MPRPRGVDVDWSKKPRSKSYQGGHKHPLYLISIQWRDDTAVMVFEGPRHQPFELLAGDERRGLLRADLLRAGVFQLPAHLNRR